MLWFTKKADTDIKIVNNWNKWALRWTVLNTKSSLSCRQTSQNLLSDKRIFENLALRKQYLI